jgi:Uma2 family endonuclease
MKLADLDVNKMYTYADYFLWQIEERVELIKGQIFRMAPAPNAYHQELVVEILTKVKNALQNKSCRVFVAPFDVRLPRKSKEDNDIITVLQPDVCVVCDPSKIDIRGCLGAPDIVVEVLSPGNNAKELKNKYDVYEESGVKEYWVVSPQNQTIQVYILKDGVYVTSRTKVAGDVITTVILPGLELNLTELFENKGYE